jgi:hypothetical protein
MLPFVVVSTILLPHTKRTTAAQHLLGGRFPFADVAQIEPRPLVIFLFGQRKEKHY